MPKISVSTRQPMHVWRNNKARSRNHSFSGKAISIIYSECEYVALGNQHAMRMRCIQHAMRMRCIVHLWPVRLNNIFPHYLTNGTIFSRKKKINTKCVF
jgi:hypothetical protein